ncbi:MAG TPA: DUF1801 domain-containing protein [Flavobacteriales bacterium]
MSKSAETPDQYVASLPDERKEVIQRLRIIFQKNLPKGFTEQMSYGMIGYVVPHSLYPAGYHCSPELPLPFLSIASQKAGIHVYHMGIYADPQLFEWFTSEYPKHCKTKLDMGKSCIRFKKLENIPYELLAELAKKMTPQDWIDLYEKNYRKK